MDYVKHYNQLIARAPKLSYIGDRKHSWKARDGVYREAHRVLPGCLGGTYACHNVAYLLPEEHFVAHQLLVKVYPNNSDMVYAAMGMTIESPDHEGGRVTHKQYGWLRRAFSVVHSKYMTENNPMAGKPSPRGMLNKNHNTNTRSLMSKSNSSHITVICPHCKKSGGMNVMPRWHFDNCKQRIIP